jgi:hypothetical protein
MTVLKTHPPMLDELLADLNSGTDIAIKLAYAMKTIPFLRTYMESTVDANWCTIDVDAVEYVRYDYHRSMAGAFLLNRHTENIFVNVLMKKDVAKRAKVFQFKALSEMLFVGECATLTAIMRKDLAAVYPNLTHETIVAALNINE